MNMATGKFVAYYRVSTDRQGRSGLGLDAQRAAVTEYLNGGDWQLVEVFEEIESGKNADRPQLAAALVACRLHRAVLVIAKLATRTGRASGRARRAKVDGNAPSGRSRQTRRAAAYAPIRAAEAIRAICCSNKPSGALCGIYDKYSSSFKEMSFS
jgi:Resolvase, N terminal domain